MWAQSQTAATPPHCGARLRRPQSAKVDFIKPLSALAYPAQGSIFTRRDLLEGEPASWPHPATAWPPPNLGCQPSPVTCSGITLRRSSMRSITCSTLNNPRTSPHLWPTTGRVILVGRLCGLGA